MDSKNKMATIIPASDWPARCLSFKIRKRGFLAYNNTSLLISNPLGVWSVRRGRYLTKRRFHRFSALKAEALPVERRYADLRKLGMYDERVAFLRSKLVDIYWDAAPAWYKEDVIHHYRVVRRRLIQEFWEMRFIFAPISVVLLAVTSFTLVKNIEILGKRVELLLIFIVFCIFQAVLWCIMLFKRDPSVLKMLERLHKGYVPEILE